MIGIALLFETDNKDGKDLLILLVTKTPSDAGGKKRKHSDSSHSTINPSAHSKPSQDPRVCTSPGTTEEATASVPSGNH